MVVGGNSSATGDYAVAAGTNTNAVGNASLALGYSLWSASFAGLVVGSCNDTSDAPNQNTFNPLNRIFQVGNGTANNVRSNALTVLQNGNVGIGVLHPAQMLEVAANITVQNGKGIIRSADGTQLKKLTTSVAVNVTLSAGSTTAYNFTFPENFSGTPDVYVGNVISGAGGWAEVVMSIANVTPGGGTLYVNNPRTGNWSPVFTVKIIAIGPQ
jgi:hypothetical protein